MRMAMPCSLTSDFLKKGLEDLNNLNPSAAQLLIWHQRCWNAKGIPRALIGTCLVYFSMRCWLASLLTSVLIGKSSLITSRAVHWKSHTPWVRTHEAWFSNCWTEILLRGSELALGIQKKSKAISSLRMLIGSKSLIRNCLFPSLALGKSSRILSPSRASY